MFRREVLEKIGQYRAENEITLMNDYDLISRVSSRLRVANLSEQLVEYFEIDGILSGDIRISGRRG